MMVRVWVKVRVKCDGLLLVCAKCDGLGKGSGKV